jgi:Rubredoxin
LQDKRALKLKHFVVKEFNKVDVCVHGLTFGVRTKQEPAFCAILIERIPGIRLFYRLDLFVRYRLLHAKHFNANTCEYEEYMPQVPRYHLPEVLQGLTRKFYAQLYEIREKHSSPSKIEKRNEEMVFQCPHCFSIYSEKTGDILRGIPVNTPFALVPETYRCPLCDAPKKDFRVVMMSMLLKGAIV